VRTFRAGGLFVYEWGDRGDPALLYWDGLGGTGLHANELAPILVAEHGLHVIAPDAPGHGRSPALPPDSYRPSRLAELAAGLLSELGLDRAAFLGFSWGGRVACAFAAGFPERTAGLVLVEGGIFLAGAPTGLEACVAEARREREEETFESWAAFFAYERESLRRWSPALEEAHRAVMLEENGKVAPILDAESLGAIAYGNGLEPVTETYPAIAAAGVPVLLVYASRPEVAEPVARFRAALPEAKIEPIADAIHDLISFVPETVAALTGRFAFAQPPP
jgi:pimeloyl-ACP methyl ester carboxylesterase